MGHLPLIPALLCTVALPDTGYESFDERFPLELVAVEDPGGSRWMEELDWIRLHPLDLNSAALGDLLAVPSVTPSGAKAVLAFREGGGIFRSPADLLTMPEGGEGIYRALLPYATVSGSRRASRHRALLRVRASGESPGSGSAIGPPSAFVSRLRFEGPGVEGGFLASRRTGERGRDAFLSAYAALGAIGWITEGIAGDYDVTGGLGLAVERGPAASADIWVRPHHPGFHVTPHRTPDQSRFMRGLALMVKIAGSWNGAIFLSARSYGAGVDSAGSAEGFTTGPYTTAASAARKNGLRENLIGMRCERRLRDAFTAGVTAWFAAFSRELAPSDGMRLTGNRSSALGADIRWQSADLFASAECARMRGGATAYACELALPAEGRGMFLLRWRECPPGFDNPHAEEGYRNSRSLSAAVRMNLSSSSWVECRCDAVERPWPAAQSPVPRREVEMSLASRAGAASRGSVFIRLSRREARDIVTGLDALGRDLSRETATGDLRLRVEAESPCAGGIVLGGAVECHRSTGAGVPTGRGLVLGAGIRWLVSPRASLSGRCSVYRGNAYSARVYDEEGNLPGVYSARPMYGRGLRWYLRARARLISSVDLSARYAVTVNEAPDAGSLERTWGVQADVTIP